MALTETAIRNAKPQPKPRKLADAGGLYLLLTPKGGRWWRLAAYLHKRRRIRRFSTGRGAAAFG